MDRKSTNQAFKHSKQPLYQQLVTVFRRYIETGLWSRGERIPSIETLMVQHKVGRVTVRSALAELIAEGIIASARGVGTVVTQAESDKDMRFNIAYTWDDLVEFGKQSGLEVVTENTNDPQALPQWCQHEGTLAQHYHGLERIYLRGQTRVCFSLVYLASDVYQRWRHQFQDRAIAAVFGETPELELGNGHQTLTIISAGADTAAALRIPVGSPIAEIVRRVYAPDQRLLYWSRVHFPSKYVRMDFILR